LKPAIATRLTGNAHEDTMSHTQITIGIPVYNEEKHLENTLDSVLSNNPGSVIISDNASTDKSGEIAERYSRIHACITYKRFDSPVNVLDNFNYSLNTCQTELFMWCGGHDLIPPNYLSELLEALKKNDVMSFSPANMIDPHGQLISVYDYHFANLLENDDPFIRTISLITHLTNCSLFHGLFRTNTLRKVSKDLPRCIGNDHVLLCRAATEGTFGYTRKTRFGRRIVFNESIAQANVRRAKSFGVQNIDAKESALHQFKTICGINTKNYRNKIFWCENAKAILTSRFGKFM
jgi:glycosyltransferase involved in cell wall biosynthesis